MPVVYNYQTFLQTKYIGQTDHKPSRIKVTNVSSREYITVSWEHGLNILENHLAAANKMFEKMQLLGERKVTKVVICGLHDNSGYIITGVR